MNKLAFIVFVIMCLCKLQAANHIDIMKKIDSETAKTLQSTYQMKVCGIGGGAMYGIQTAFLAFDIRRTITLEEARSILVGSTELYLKNINSNKLIRPYLSEFPFTAKGIHIEFYVNTFDKEKDPKKIEGFSLLYGGNFKVPTVDYDGYDENGRLITIFTETYDQAKERLDASKK